jgi:hypothetical protein
LKVETEHKIEKGAEGAPTDKKKNTKKKPKDEISSSDSENDDEDGFLEQMKAFFGESPEEQMDRLRNALLVGTQNIAGITSKEKQIEMLLSVIALSETMVNKSTEEEPGFKFFTQNIS